MGELAEREKGKEIINKSRAPGKKARERCSQGREEEKSGKNQIPTRFPGHVPDKPQELCSEDFKKRAAFFILFRILHLRTELFRLIFTSFPPPFPNSGLGSVFLRSSILALLSRILCSSEYAKRLPQTSS